MPLGYLLYIAWARFHNDARVFRVRMCVFFQPGRTYRKKKTKTLQASLNGALLFAFAGIQHEVLFAFHMKNLKHGFSDIAFVDSQTKIYIIRILGFLKKKKKNRGIK